MSPEFTIRPATPQDAPMIAEAIMMAIGEDMVSDLSNGRGRNAVTEIFSRLAASKDAQYSYTNSLVAEAPDGRVAGIVVAYDGKILIEARRLFFALTPELLGWDIHDIVPDGEPEVETDPSEYYLDTLAVWPQYRGHGIATALIEAVAIRAAGADKPVGLLCARHNDSARAVYEHLGFREIGQRPFAGELMAHMVR